ncbi:MAG: hypothetical protein U0586_11720 [Candidatus Brocadiaceae bacterium]
MTVKRIFTNGKTIDISGTGYAPEGHFYRNDSTPEIDHWAVKLTLGLGVLCNNAYLKKDNDTWKVIGDPTEGAILSAAAKAGMWKESLTKKIPLVSEIPFDSNRKKMSTIRGSPTFARV